MHVVSVHVEAYVADLAPHLQVVLGLPFMLEHRVELRPHDGVCTVLYNGHCVALQQLLPPPPPRATAEASTSPEAECAKPLLSASQLRVCLRTSRQDREPVEVFLCCMAKASVGDHQQSSPELEKLMHEFADVFPEELPADRKSVV